MNILVAAMFEGDTQNPKIMRILCAEWERMGHRVVRFYPCSSKESYYDLLNNKDFYPFYLPVMSKYDIILRQLALNKNKIISLFLTIFKHPVFVFEYIIRRIKLFDDTFGKPGIIKREINKACKKNDYDLIIVGSNPFFLAHGVSKATCHPLKVWFQMDPHSNNGMIRKNKLNHETKSEFYVYKHMDKVFVQPNAYSEIVDKYDESITKKVIPTRFPLVNPYVQVKSNKSYFEKNTINCVYSGALMMPIRRPEYMFNLFSKLSSKKIHLYVWSSNLTDKRREEMISLMPSNVTYCGSLPQQEMQCVLAGADFLVSLGNTVTNQLPSKILDYISLRKPIINIYKTENCPTRSIISDYPLGLNISEKEDISEAAFRLESFIGDSIGDLVDPQIVCENFHDYLPINVADYVLSNIFCKGFDDLEELTT